jgi:hypothetical protein
MTPSAFADLLPVALADPDVAFPVDDAATPTTPSSFSPVCAHELLPHLEPGRLFDAPVLRGTLVQAFGGSDVAGLWDSPLARQGRAVETRLPVIDKGILRAFWWRRRRRPL